MIHIFPPIPKETSAVKLNILRLSPPPPQPCALPAISSLCWLVFQARRVLLGGKAHSGHHCTVVHVMPFPPNNRNLVVSFLHLCGFFPKHDPSANTASHLISYIRRPVGLSQGRQACEDILPPLCFSPPRGPRSLQFVLGQWTSPFLKVRISFGKMARGRSFGEETTRFTSTKRQLLKAEFFSFFLEAFC